MKIETKFNVGDKVIFISGSEIWRETILQISFVADNDHVNVYYRVYDPSHESEINYTEQCLFKTQDELLNSLRKQEIDNEINAEWKEKENSFHYQY